MAVVAFESLNQLKRFPKSGSGGETDLPSTYGHHAQSKGVLNAIAGRI
jgi:hypothetical protein